MSLTTTVALSLATLLASVAAHYEVLAVLARLTAGRPGSRRISLFVAITGLLAVHMCEIALFAGAFYIGASALDLGSFVSARTMAPMDYFYYAAETYSSLGYGDIYPLGTIRLLASITPVIGLLLMGWSSAFLFSLVQPRDPPSDGKHDVSASS
jgi:hypothetical protein